MAHLWRISDTDEWEPVLLSADPLVLGSDNVPVSLRRVPLAHDGTWLLLAPRSDAAFVNGLRVAHGIAVLADCDEIRLSGGQPLFFSTERLAHVEPYPDVASRGFCPRCKQTLEAGASAVKCPGCGLWHHASEPLPCWNYADRCAACPQPTAPEIGFRWTPEELA